VFSASLYKVGYNRHHLLHYAAVAIGIIIGFVHPSVCLPVCPCVRARNWKTKSHKNHTWRKRLDYCDALAAGVANRQMSRLQSLQNTAAVRRSMSLARRRLSVLHSAQYVTESPSHFNMTFSSLQKPISLSHSSPISKVRKKLEEYAGALAAYLILRLSA